MKLFLKLKPVLVAICFFAANILSADGPGTTHYFSPLLQNGIGGAQSSTYNSQNNQFLFSWLSNTSEINVVVCDTDGNQIGSQKTVSAASSSSSVCYNSIDNQYFATWFIGGTTIAFSILDDTGNVTVGTNTIPMPGFGLSGNVLCCYNSTDNQYCITWTAENGGTSSTYFAIINSDGTIAKNITQITDVSGQTTSNSTDSFVTYNSKNNQYLFTWLGTDGSNGTTTFAIYNANGNVVVPAKIVPQVTGFNAASSPIYSCYNVTENQYFISWVSTEPPFGDLHGFFAIYNHLGTEIVPATEISTTTAFYQVPVCSYNGRNNQYFVSWNDSNTQALCSIFDANGNVVSSQVVLPILLSNTPNGLVFNSFSTQDDKFFITWYASGGTCAYYNIFTLTPTPIVIDTIQATPSIISKGNSSTLTATFHGGFQPYTAIWSDGTMVTNINALTTSYIVSPTSTKTYSVKITDTYGDSVTSNKVKVTVLKPISINAITVQHSAIVCGSSEITVRFSGGKAPYTATWSDGTIVMGITGTTVTRKVSPTSTKTYSVKITDNYGDSVTSNKVTITVIVATTFIAALREKYN